MANDEFLEHFGILGMHWGKHKASNFISDFKKHREKKRKEKEEKIKKMKDEKWEKTQLTSTYFKVYNKAVDEMNPLIESFNNQKKWANMDLIKRPNDSIAKQYYKEYSDKFTSILNKHASELGLSPSGSKKMVFEFDASDESTNGFPTFKIVDVNEKLKHCDICFDLELSHYGILGMHWGRRKGRSNITEINTSDDHKKKISLKKKRISEMSNSELKALNERMQLERQYKDLTRSEVSSGKKFVMEVLGNAAKQTASTYVSKYMNKSIDELLKKTNKK